MSDMVVDADAELLARLRAGDEDAFIELVDRYGPLMLRIALAHVRTRAVAEEVVQEAWLGVAQRARPLRGPLLAEDLDPAHPRQHARKTRGEREARTVPLSSLGPERDEPAVEPGPLPRRRRPASPATGARTRATGAGCRRSALLGRETLEVVIARRSTTLPPRAAAW